MKLEREMLTKYQSEEEEGGGGAGEEGGGEVWASSIFIPELSLCFYFISRLHFPWHSFPAGPCSSFPQLDHCALFRLLSLQETLEN